MPLLNSDRDGVRTLDLTPESRGRYRLSHGGKKTRNDECEQRQSLKEDQPLPIHFSEDQLQGLINIPDNREKYVIISTICLYFLRRNTSGEACVRVCRFHAWVYEIAGST
ncbi:hypothetical protein SK128_021377 [Halocaridina rubra]|uniref:Uncharacterized protein n=1 Tax=Halocaridina rubra TaxID=373956 RepID=A0AAN8XBZ2_HALRR